MFIEERIRLLEIRVRQLESAKHLPDTFYGKVAAIIEFVATRAEISKAELLGKSRPEHIRWPRHGAIWLAQQITGASSVRLGKAFRRDYSTICNALTIVQNRRDTEPAYLKLTDAWLQELRAMQNGETK